MFTHINNRRRLTLTTMALVVAAAVVAYSGLQSTPARATTAAAIPAVSVSVAAVPLRDVMAWDVFSGRLEAVEQVALRSRVSGAVQSVHFQEGALVKAGEVLITIDPAPYQAEADRAAAQLQAAQAQVGYAHTELERARRLWADHAIAQRDLDERNNAALNADANVRAAQAALQSATLNLGYTQVRAPVSGKVGRLLVTKGNLVSAGADSPVLTTLVSVNPMYVSFDADEQTVTRALADLPAGGLTPATLGQISIEVGAGEVADHRGRLQLVDNTVDPRSGTIRLRAVLDNRDGSLIAGQFVRIRLGKAKTHPQLLVSEQAIGTDQDKRFVMVVGADNKATYREVKLGATVDGLRIVTAGLKAGERIIVTGLQKVQPGSVVQPHDTKMDAFGRAESASGQS